MVETAAGQEARKNGQLDETCVGVTVVESRCRAIV